MCNSLGQLLLCSFCPTAVHLECVQLTHIPDGDYRCSTCQAALGPAGRPSSATPPSMAHTTTGNSRAPTDSSGLTPCHKSIHCSRAARHIGRCNRGLSAAATTSHVHNAMLDTGPFSSTEVATAPPDTGSLPFAEVEPRYHITRRRRRQDLLQRLHTARQDLDADDQRLYEVEMTHEERRATRHDSQGRAALVPDARHLHPSP